MTDLTRSDLLKLFPQVIEVNKELEWFKKEFPGITFISEAIALNEKFLSYRKQIEEGSDEKIPDELQPIIADVNGALRTAIIMICIQRLRYLCYTELIYCLRRTRNGF